MCSATKHSSSSCSGIPTQWDLPVPHKCLCLTRNRRKWRNTFFAHLLVCQNSCSGCQHSLPSRLADFAGVSETQKPPTAWGEKKKKKSMNGKEVHKGKTNPCILPSCWGPCRKSIALVPFQKPCQRTRGKALQGLQLSLGPAPRENEARGCERSQIQTKLPSGISLSCHFSLWRYFMPIFIPGSFSL